ncbi:MAG: HlyC/CorC family transporter [Bdellovibrionales bacterium]|nr:HlyC/CorC family transporter [Bdellovibrionales bacterium]
MTLLIFYFLLAVFVSFACSLMESVILSVSPAYIAVAINKNKRSGHILGSLKSNIDQPLAAILTLNTIANVVGATGVGAQVLIVYGDGYVAATSFVLTIIILIFSEIIPKTLGATHWKLFAPICAYLIKGLIYLTYPFVLLSNFISNLLSTGKAKQVTREEMIVTAEIGANEGSIRQKESRVIKNLLMLDNISVSDIMTPRSVMYTFNKNETIAHVMEQNKQIRFSRIPLYTTDLDHVEGMVHRYKILEAASHDLDDLPLEKLITPIHRVPETISVAAVLDQFIKRKEHLFLVIDEYGSTAGLVTLEDTVETLLGVEIVDEFDNVEDMRQFALEKWRSRKSNI